MDIGFTGGAVVVLRKPIDDEEPTRIFVELLGVSEAGVSVSFEDSEEEKRTCFIPFSNIKCIEKAEPQEAESGGAPAPDAAVPTGTPVASSAASPGGAPAEGGY